MTSTRKARAIIPLERRGNAMAKAPKALPKWDVYPKSGGAAQAYSASSLTVAENGTLVFVNNGIVNFVIPADAYSKVALVSESD